jgi:XTP/dITP diphosphohydrolase
VELVLATANEDKAAEIVRILEQARIRLRPRPPGLPEVDEVGETLLDNARLKARAVAQAAGLPAIADDTGLEVDALGGEPGVRSARYSGPGATYSSNVAQLLSRLEGLPRQARFRTVMVVAWPDGREVVAEGSVEGTISDKPRGAAGFGYDPVFVPSEGDGRTFAEMAPMEKDHLSHRARALRALAVALASAEGGEGKDSECSR